MVKKILKYTLITLVGIVLGLVLVPIVFKDKIIAYVKKEVNKNLNATVEFSDVDISLLRSFPKASIQLEDFSVTGIDSFENIRLIDAKVVDIHTNLTPIFNSNVAPVIHFLKAEDANINVLKLANGSANYLITKPSSDTTAGFELDLEGYELTNSQLKYEDRGLDLLTTLKGLNLTGEGALSSDIYDLDIKSSADTMSLTYAGIDYVDEAQVALDAKININFPEEKYTLLDNVISINELDGTGAGFVQFVPKGILFDFNLNTEGEAFKNYISALPFLPYDKNMQASGTADLKAMVKGIYNGDTGLYPAIDVKSTISGASFKYPDLSFPIEGINASLRVTANDERWNDFTIDVPKFSLGVNKEQVNGRIKVSNALGNGIVDGELKGTIRLENWVKALPIEGVETFAGSLFSDLSFNASTAAISNQDYEKIKFDGSFKVNDIAVKTAGKPMIKLASGNAQASPAALTISTTGLELGKSKLNLGGNINNPLGVFLSEAPLMGKLDLTGSLLDLNEWQSDTNENTAPTGDGVSPLPNLENRKASDVILHIDLSKVLFGDLVLNNLTTDSEIGLNHANIRNFSVSHDGNDVALEGNISNIYAYLFGNGTLEGNLNMKSKNFDANKYLAEETQSEQTASTIMIPENVNIQVNAQIDQLKYSNFDLKNSKGIINIANSEMVLRDVSTKAFGGEIAMSGFYRTVEKQPDYSVRLDLSKLRINELFANTVTMQALAPIGKFLSGYMNTTLVMDGKLGEDMTPLFPTLNASGFIETFSSKFTDLKIIDILAEKLGVEELKKLNLDNTKNWFEVKQGYVELKERMVSVAGIDGKIAGKHQISGPMEYTLFLKVPRTMLQKNKATATLEKGWSWVEKEASKRGLNINQGEYIDFRVDIGGRLAQPTIAIVPIASSGKSMQEEIQDEVEKEVGQMVDSVKTVLNDKKEQVIDTISNRANEELDKIKDKVKDQVETKTDEVLNQTKDVIKKEVGTAIDSTLGVGVTDSLARKAQDIIKEKTGGNVDDIMKKIDDYNPFKKKKN